MASKKKQTKSAPAASPAQTKTGAPSPASSSSVKASSTSTRLPLVIMGIGVLVVLAVGGLFVWMNQQAAPVSAPQLAAGWVPGAVTACRGVPKFAADLGFSRSVVFSTSERLNKGMQLIEPGANGDLTTGRRYQDPSWTQGGYLGVFVPDRAGNVYVAPSPRISLIDNPPDKANVVYKVDALTGKMAPLINLPSAAPPSDENPYGILALTYDCDTNSLYATTVMGSNRANQVGRIYQIDPITGELLSRYDGVDAFGVGVFNHLDGKRLYFGSARNPEVYSIALDAKGKFVGEPHFEFTLNGPFNRPRRIDFDQRGDMLVRGIDFNFTLSATSEDRRTDYRFGYDQAAKTWTQLAP